jgi:Ca-activated chloride channel family protein
MNAKFSISTRISTHISAYLWAALSACLLACLCACQPGNESTASSSANDTGPTFRILAGSELKDVADLVTAFGQTQRIRVVFDYSGTLDAVDILSEAHRYDAVWVSHGKYLKLVPAVKQQIRQSEKTMYSRVVLGVKPAVAQALGWQSGQTGWADVLKQAQTGQFRFAMTNPTGSNTGFVALAGLAAEWSGKGDALEEADIPVAKLRELFAGQALSAGSSGSLAEMFVAQQDRLDGIINYESVIRSMAAKGTPLSVIIPKEGVISADYPLMLLAGSSQTGFYQKLVEHLRSAPIQKVIADTTFRTPLAGSGGSDVVNELPFPASLKVVDAILQGFLNQYSRPASSYFAIDVSGSMRGERINQVKTALNKLLARNQTGSGRFATLRAREHIEILPFSDQPQENKIYDLSQDDAANQQVLGNIGLQVNQLFPDGGTAIFGAIASLYPRAQAELRQGGRRVSIVLLTDGENTDGMSLASFRSFIAQQGEPHVPVFAILYGDAKPAEMQQLADSTGGRVFDARQISLTRVMKDIRSFQ